MTESEQRFLFFIISVNCVIYKRVNYLLKNFQLLILTDLVTHQFMVTTRKLKDVFQENLSI
jgi:hypothetical protein